jgi:hypothetical protein
MSKKDAELAYEYFNGDKQSASDGYLLAKRQIIEAIDNRLEIIDGTWDAVSELEKLRSYVKNVMLWKN